MRKIAFLSILILCLFVCAGAPVHGAVSQPEGSSIERLTDCYQSQIGVTEATGRNDGVQVEKYLKSVNLGKGHAWCAAFVCWSYQCADMKGPRSAWSPSLFPSQHTIYVRDKVTNTPWQPGDIFGIYFPNLRRIGHVGFIDKNGDTYTTTVEGNTNPDGSRDGDGVYRRRRLNRHIYKVSRYS